MSGNTKLEHRFSNQDEVTDCSVVSVKILASSLFNGQGSYGNGAAMRVTPIGAFFAEDLDLVVKQAQASAKITYTHPEAIAGAIAVAVAAAWAARLQGSIPSKEEVKRTGFD